MLSFFCFHSFESSCGCTQIRNTQIRVGKSKIIVVHFKRKLVTFETVGRSSEIAAERVFVMKTVFFKWQIKLFLNSKQFKLMKGNVIATMDFPKFSILVGALTRLKLLWLNLDFQRSI